ncbi:MAG: hypothetical protein JWO31_2477, partial [Phycisphaerales bacterium]|nr:hypothetical protein [Phycisphaerales bacterium]
RPHPDLRRQQAVPGPGDDLLRQAARPERVVRGQRRDRSGSRIADVSGTSDVGWGGIRSATRFSTAGSPAATGRPYFAYGYHWPSSAPGCDGPTDATNSSGPDSRSPGGPRSSYHQQVSPAGQPGAALEQAARRTAAAGRVPLAGACPQQRVAVRRSRVQVELARRRVDAGNGGCRADAGPEPHRDVRHWLSAAEGGA